jgi:hypothetical protein
VRWKKDHVTRTFAASRSELGLAGTKRKVEMKTVGDRTCAVAGVLAFDVDDAYAFDVDEPVDVTITYAPDLSTAPFAVGWDRNGGDGYGVSTDIKPDPGAPLRRVTLRLDRARLAGQGILKSDLAIGARNQGAIALCDIEIARSNATRAPASFGRLHLDLKDAQTGRAAAARVGLYDATGRIPLPSDDAVPVHRFADEARLWMNRRTFWTSTNRQAFYVNGRYDARARRHLRADPDARTRVSPRAPEDRRPRERDDDGRHRARALCGSAGRRLVSGDSHIHLMRDAAADPADLGTTGGRDVHVGNLLEMEQHRGHDQAAGVGSRRAVRTRRLRDGARPGGSAHRHARPTIHWNLKSHVHFEKEAFFQHDRVFERTRSQGALTGYAHLGELFNGRRGLALDVRSGCGLHRSPARRPAEHRHLAASSTSASKCCRSAAPIFPTSDRRCPASSARMSSSMRRTVLSAPAPGSTASGAAAST